MLEHTGSETDPLGPENVLLFMAGPLTGTKAFSADRFEVITKSPLTGIYAESDCGGHWAEAMKRCGVDGLMIVGQAKRPAHIVMDDDGIRIEDGRWLWGKDTYQVDDLVKARLGGKAQTVCIGIAGENLVKIASIMTDGRHGRAAARAAIGAVMGSKRLKAITAMGTKKVPLAREEELDRFVKEWAPKIRESAKVLADYGTSCGIEYMEKVGDFPIKNWLDGNFAKAPEMTGQHMARTILKKSYHCGRCVLGYGRTVEVAGDKYSVPESAGPEYETISMLGANCLIGDLEAISKGNELCNRFGLDTISTGNLIAFCMEAWERGLVDGTQTGGLVLEWGSAEAMLGMVDRIARRKDLGRVLGEGLRAACSELGGNSEEFAMQVKGLDFPGHDPRAKVAVGLSYATSNRGACHLQSFSADFEDSACIPDLGYSEPADRFETKGKGKFVADHQNLMSLFDSVRCCRFMIFGGITVEPLLEMMNMVTGWDWSKEEFLQAGERIYNLKRMYNVRMGMSRKDDTLPPRILNQPRGGGSGDNLPILNEMLKEYYRVRGWDEFGIPSPDTLKRLELQALAETA